MATEPKISRKDLKLKQPDQFQVISARLVEFCLKNQRILILVSFMFVAAVAGLWSYSKWLKANDLKMENRYFEIDKLRIQIEKEPSPALLNQMQEMLPGFTEGSQKSRARLLLADIYYREGRYDEAIALYQEVIGKTSLDDLKYDVARSGLAHSLEGMKDYKKAIEIYKSIIDSTQNFPLFYTYVGLARCHELSGDPQSAILVLRQVQNKFKSHLEIGKVDLRIRRLEGQV